MEMIANAQTRWYRSGYVWLVLAPLLVTVVGFFYTMYLLFASGNIDQLPGLGSKLGKIYTDQVSVPVSVTLQSQQAAADGSGYRALLLLTLPTEVDTATGTRVRLGEQLELHLLHPTLSNRDRQLTLQRSVRDHVAQLDAPLPERGVLWLRDPVSDWQQVLPYRLRDGELLLRDTADG